MKNRFNLTHTQKKAVGIKMHDNGVITHAAEKAAHSRKNDNVKPDAY